MTKPSPTRRALRFESVEALAAEVERCARAQRAGGLRATGEWTPAQVFEHVAKLIEFSYDGFPFRGTLGERVVTHLGKWIAWRPMIDRAFRPGYRLRLAASALLPDPAAQFEPSAARLQAALGRIARGEPMRQPSPFEGRLTHEQWVYVHLRHAELHLSFLQLDGG